VKTVFVTGASGTIGMEVCFDLLKKGYKVIATDKKTNEFAGRENYTFIQANITDKSAVSNILSSNSIDAVIYLANSVDNDIPSVITDQELNDNKAADKYFWKAVESSKIKDVMLLSTHQVYAPTKSREPVREASDLKPVTDYGKMKLDSENNMASAFKKSDSNIIILRVAPIYKSSYPQNLRDRIYDPKEDAAYLYNEGSYGFSLCCIYNLVEFINAILAGPQGHYSGEYNICDTKITLAKDIIAYEKSFQRISKIVQRTGSPDSILGGFGSKKSKSDYRFIDPSTYTSNILYDNTKAKRFSTFRWTLANTK